LDEFEDFLLQFVGRARQNPQTETLGHLRILKLKAITTLNNK
jgi:hypothetical protein